MDISGETARVVMPSRAFDDSFLSSVNTQRWQRKTKVVMPSRAFDDSFTEIH